MDMSFSTICASSASPAGLKKKTLFKYKMFYTFNHVINKKKIRKYTVCSPYFSKLRSLFILFSVRSTPKKSDRKKNAEESKIIISRQFRTIRLVRYLCHEIHQGYFSANTVQLVRAYKKNCHSREIALNLFGVLNSAQRVVNKFKKRHVLNIATLITSVNLFLHCCFHLFSSPFISDRS